MKILVVDDSKAMRGLIVRALHQAGLPDLEIVEASDGFEAFSLASSQSLDLVLADWTMSGVSGIDLLRGLRGGGNDVPFGFVTAQSGEVRRAEAREAGAQFLVGKPFTPEELAESVCAYATD
jgi:two-component system chemotaxis response regulator CheY